MVQNCLRWMQLNFGSLGFYFNFYFFEIDSAWRAFKLIYLNFPIGQLSGLWSNGPININQKCSPRAIIDKEILTPWTQSVVESPV